MTQAGNGKRQRLLAGILAILGIVLLTIPAWAQSVRGSLAGTLSLCSRFLGPSLSGSRYSLHR